MIRITDETTNRLPTLTRGNMSPLCAIGRKPNQDAIAITWWPSEQGHQLQWCTIDSLPEERDQASKQGV